ncbi:hypothetical protein EDC96DRAFT_576031 [Choanephora cucurbitarum]|nr:hypothetical protein EDC96DRAFT_576031 [Choanephora cucurbitarum]
MTAVYLPIELHWKILSYLDKKDRSQYRLVSKEWNRAARHLLFREVHIDSHQTLDHFVKLLVESPSLGELVKDLRLTEPPDTTKALQYISLIQLTPNLRSIRTGYDADHVYQIAVQEVQHGHWSQLCSIKNRTHRLGACPRQADDASALRDSGYHALLSKVQDRLLHVALDITPISHFPYELYCFLYPDHITRTTRFNRSKRLICLSRKVTHTRSLHDAIKLCPHADEIVLRLEGLEGSKDSLTQIKSNRSIEHLSMHLIDIKEEDSLGYFYHMFPYVEHLLIQISMQTNSPPMSIDTLNQLTHYAYSKGVCQIIFYHLENREQLLLSFISHQWQGETIVCLDYDYVDFVHDHYKPRRSRLKIKWDLDKVNFMQPGLRTYLNQLDELELDQLGLQHRQLLTHCTQLQLLRINCRSRNTYNSEHALPITHLVLHGRYSTSPMNKISTLAPNLQHVTVDLESPDKAVIDMPFTSLHSLCIRISTYPNNGQFYIQLVQSQESTFYRSLGSRLRALQQIALNPFDDQPKNLGNYQQC